MPRPSHPRSMVITLGDRISIIIEIMNSITMWVNRWRWGSPIMYSLENVSTLNEI